MIRRDLVSAGLCGFRAGVPSAWTADQSEFEGSCGIRLAGPDLTIGDEARRIRSDPVDARIVLLAKVSGR